MRRSRRARRGAPAAEDYTANQPPDVLDHVVVHAVGTAIDGILRAWWIHRATSSLVSPKVEPGRPPKWTAFRVTVMYVDTRSHIAPESTVARAQSAQIPDTTR